MGTFDFMIERFADVVEEAGFLRSGDIDAEFGGHDGHQLRDFDRMIQNILRVTTALLIGLLPKSMQPCLKIILKCLLRNMVHSVAMQ